MAERRSFVVRVEPSGRSTVEDVRTGTSVAVAALADIGYQIEAWLALAGRASDFNPGEDPGPQG